jgi:disulfide bond formation protein DsbB
MNTDPSTTQATAPLLSGWGIYCCAWLVALIATLSALFIGEVLGQMPCTLCWYQRIAMFPLVIILGIGCFRSELSAIRYAIPLVLAGLGFALYHSLVYSSIITQITPCDTSNSCSGSAMTLFGWLPLPYLALLSFSFILCLLIIVVRKNPS